VTLLLATGVAAATDPSVHEFGAELLARLNQARAAAGAPPLVSDAALAVVAQERAAEAAARGGLAEEGDIQRVWSQVERRLRGLGYSPHAWTESMVATRGGPDEVLDGWRDGANWQDLLRPDYRHAAVGVAALGRPPLYARLVAFPRADAYGRETRPLTDLERLRREALATVNAARLAAGRPPLASDPRLDEAAQAHALDMLRRSYYDHRSPDGGSPLARVSAAGFAATLVGENLAAGMRTLDEAMSAWLQSSGHRRNILEPRFTHFGVGVAVGPYEDRHQVLWVQEFARP
jgi:uncharacterized protein YkwD